MNLKSCLISFALSFNVLASDFVGQVIEENGKYFLKSENQSNLEIILPKKYQYTLPTMVSPYFQKFSGSLKDNQLHADEIPTTVAGSRTEIGLLEQASDGTYTINNKKVVFRDGKILNDHKFDEESKDFFLNKKIEAEGSDIILEDGSKAFEMVAIVLADLFSAKKNTYSPVGIQQNIETAKNPFKFLIKKFPRNIYAQNENSFRTTIFEKEGYAPQPGEKALLVTLSGRTGDHVGSSAGHFVAGRATVRNDLSLVGDYYNAYVKNEKEIFSSNTSLPYYYGHVIGGQNVHRPTYTLVIYMEKAEEIGKTTRDIVDLEHPQLRTSDAGITPNYNCTTINMKGLLKAGFIGDHDFLFKKITDKQNIAYLNPLLYLAPKDKGILGPLSYVAAVDKERFMPRPGFESYIKALSNKNYRKKNKIKRVDFIHYTQTPSSRPMGGIPYSNPLKAVKVKKFIDNGQTFDPEVEEWLNNIGQ